MNPVAVECAGCAGCGFIVKPATMPGQLFDYLERRALEHLTGMADRQIDNEYEQLPF